MRSGLGFASSVILLVSSLIFVVLAFPLAVFVVESARDSNLIQYNATYTFMGGDAVNVTVTLTYRGHVPLDHFTVEVYGGRFEFDHVTAGVYEESLILTSRSLSESSVEIGFRVAGLYSFTLSGGG